MFTGNPHVLPRSLSMAKPLQHQIIARALEIISDEEHCGPSRSVARTADGRQCTLASIRGRYRFCAIGALNAQRANCWVSPELSTLTWPKSFAGRERPASRSLPCINDNCGHEVIVAMFKVALAR